jgi:type VI secretion system protein ImpA
LRRFEATADEAPELAETDTVGESAAEDGSARMPAAAPAASRGGLNIRSITSVTKRDDALYLLEIASAYFRANEPSSPLPMLIARAMRLSSMDFLDILRDLAPDGLGQAQIVTGMPPE